MEWEDLSGGELHFSINHGNYTSLHVIRVLPFDSTGTYVSPPASTETNLGQTADNFMALVKACYDNTATGGVYAANQTNSDNLGETPFPYTFGVGAAFGAGTATGANWVTWVAARLVALDGFGGRWQLELPGVSTDGLSTLGRFLVNSSSGPLSDLGKYIGRQTNGPTHAVKSAIVTHAGNPITGGMSIVGDSNQRLRRHFRVA
jgi:hypothetical protein